MKKTFNIYVITEVQAIAASAYETEAQDALRVHLIDDPYSDGDCILFGYSIADFDNDEEITEALNNNVSESDFYVDENCIYHA